ncbi:hypothetical protein BV20DRAFT_968987 [Pilatotrama ljubarskyi]|nr:hypothetical protein BV20DRAFT_968987 [Pilatotrama ljubarskyi]
MGLHLTLLLAYLLHAVTPTPPYQKAGVRACRTTVIAILRKKRSPLSHGTQSADRIVRIGRSSSLAMLGTRSFQGTVDHLNASSHEAGYIVR